MNNKYGIKRHLFQLIFILFIYYTEIQVPSPLVRHVSSQGKREEGKPSRRVKKRKGTEALRVKNPTPFWPIGVLIEEEEQNGKYKIKKIFKKHGVVL